MIAGKDPSEYGVAENGASLVRPIALEGFVVHLADHDFVAAGPACQWTAAELQTIFRNRYGVTAEKDLNALRNYVFANFTNSGVKPRRSGRGYKPRTPGAAFI